MVQTFRVVRNVFVCLYASSLPFILLNFISREMQSFLAFLWWIYLVTVCLQVASESNGPKFIPFILFYSAVYVGCEETLRYFERDSGPCDRFLLFCPLSVSTPLSIYVVRVVFFLILGITIIPFGAFIGTFSDTLIERENAAKRLQATNQELEQQLIQ